MKTDNGEFLLWFLIYKIYVNQEPNSILLRKSFTQYFGLQFFEKMFMY
jgi:hypothetical protein